MTRLLYGYSDEIAAWVADRIPHANAFSGPYTAIGVVSGDNLLAGVVFHEYQPDYGNIQVSMAADSPMWARPEIIAELLAYPFGQLRCWMLYTLIPHDNAPALKVNEHIGVKRKTVVPHYFGRKRHAVVCQMTRTEYLKTYGAP